MRHHTIAFCGFVLLAACGTLVLRPEAAHAAAFPDSQGASIHLPLPLAHGAAWESMRNTVGVKADWQFTTAAARIRLRKLYPTTDG